MKELFQMSPNDVELYYKLTAKHSVNSQRVEILKKLLETSVGMEKIIIMCANRSVAFETYRAFKKSNLPCNVTRVIDEYGNFGVRITRIPVQ